MLSHKYFCSFVVMTIPRHKLVSYLVVLICCIPLFYINIFDRSSWGDDFSQYIKEALNIANGKPWYSTTYIYNPQNTVYAPPVYPPGYPLLLAPIVKIWGISYRAIGYFNAFLIVCIAMALLSWFRRHTGKVAAVCLTLMVVYANQILDLKWNALSDIAGLLFVSLYFTCRGNSGERWRWQQILLLSVIAVMAILVRSQVILLPLAELLYPLLLVIHQLLTRQKKSNLKIVAINSLLVGGSVLLLHQLLNSTVFRAPHQSFDFYNGFIERAIKEPFHIITYHMGWLHFEYLELFHYRTFTDPTDVIGLFAAQAAVAAAAAGILILWVRRLIVEDVFFMLTSGMALMLPAHDPRYILPIMPVFYLYAYTGVHTVALAITRKYTVWIALAIVLCWFRIGYNYMRIGATTTPEGLMPNADDLVAFDRLKTMVNDSDIILFVKPRVLALYTGKRTITESWQEGIPENKEYLEKAGVRYILLRHGLDEHFYRAYMQVTPPLDSTEVNSQYVLYRMPLPVSK